MDINPTEFAYECRTPESPSRADAWRRADWCVDLAEQIETLREMLHQLASADDAADPESTARAIRTCSMQMHEVRQIVDCIGGQTY